MTAQDRLRSHLQHTAASLPTGPGSLSAVRARAAQMQRRRNAVRGGAGAFALVSVQDRGVQDSVADPETADDFDEPQIATATEADELPQGTDAAESQSFDEGRRSDSDLGGSDGGGVVFAAAVSVVAPPPDAAQSQISYSFSGGYALARAEDDWYAYDGVDWQSVGLPEGIEIGAVDVSAPDRVAAFGVVRPSACVVAHVVAARTPQGWGYVRVDDGTPPTVASELLDARVRVTETAIELERTERLWFDVECGDVAEYPQPSGDAAVLVAELEQYGEITRRSWLHAPLEPDFESQWGAVADDEAHSAALKRAALVWTPSRPTRISAALRLTENSTTADEATSILLDEAMIHEVATSVHVAGGTAWLSRGGQVWEVCPIPDPDEALAEIGWAGENLAVIVGKPEQTLFVVERTE